MFKSIGAPEIILILAIILIFFGVGKLPQVGQVMGKGIRAFKRGQNGETAEEEVPVATAKTVKKTSKPAAKKKAKDTSI